MQKYRDTVTDRNGNALQGISVLVQNYPALTTATIYSDDGITPVANPMTTDAYGTFQFYAADGRYSITISGSNITTTVISDVPLLDDPADDGADQIEFIQAGVGATPRTVQDRLRETVSVKDFGAACDDVTDDSSAVSAAMAAAVAGQFRLSIPTGKIARCNSISQGSITASFIGPGQIRTSDGNLRGPVVNQMTAAPSSEGGFGSIVTAFNGDLRKQAETVEHRVSGVATLGQPVTGYKQIPETAAQYTYLYNSSGWNQLLDWTDGRTGTATTHIKADQYGQGDISALTIGVNVFSEKPGATHFLAQPAATMINGGSDAYVDHANIVGTEIFIKDNGFDANGAGHVVHMTRNNGAGSQEAFWKAVNVNSNGTQPIDTGFSLRGKTKRGLDFAAADFQANQAAIVMKADQRVYGNATMKPSASVTGAALGWTVFDALGTAYFSYSTSLTAWSFNNNISAPQYHSTGAAGSNRGVNLRTNDANRWRVLADGSAESGGNAGSNFAITRCDDSGASIDSPIYSERVNGSVRLGVVGGLMGFFGQTSLGTRPVITGSRGGNAALTSLLTGLASLGLITDSTTA